MKPQPLKISPRFTNAKDTPRVNFHDAKDSLDFKDTTSPNASHEIYHDTVYGQSKENSRPKENSRETVQTQVYSKKMESEMDHSFDQDFIRPSYWNQFLDSVFSW